MDDVISVLNQFGYFAFAVSGTLAVSRRRLDLFGALVMAIVTAVGGGTLRDLLLGSGSVYWVDDPTPIVTATIGGVFAIAMLRRQPRVAAARSGCNRTLEGHCYNSVYFLLFPFALLTGYLSALSAIFRFAAFSRSISSLSASRTR